MEDVLDLYAQPYDVQHPVVCFDEQPVQLVAETHTPRPTLPGQPALYDYEYRRTGTANIFMTVQPLAGWRQVAVTGRRTKLDFAAQMKDLVDVHFPKAERIRVVLDNLNTHKLACLYDAYPAEEARRLARKLEFHHTPKHGSWLNPAESELSVLTRQCLSRRIESQEALARETAAWVAERNQAGVGIDYRFSLDDARNKLSHLYPS
jgi:hypothetical protein